jgi:ABC-type Fe3+-hydroxamate transport system substrate-binding protein
MSDNDDTDRRDGPTRRDYIKGGGALVGGGLLGGCSGAGSNTTPTSTETTTSEDTSYTVSMAPMGDVEFETVPETAMGFYPWYADMAIAVGHEDALQSLYAPEMFGSGMNNYYHHLDGVSIDWEGLTDPNPGNGTDKEIFYETDADVHFIDPVLLASQDGWNSGDIEDITADLGPVFGNYYSTRRVDPPEGNRDGYEYYTVWEMAEKVAAVFRERERYQEIAAVHDELLDRIESGLPPEEECPTVARVWHLDGAFRTFRTSEPGIWRADIWPLQPKDAFDGMDWENAIGDMDYEGLAEADPDVLLVMSGTTSYQNVAEIRETVSNHPVGQELTAVQNDRVYASGAAWHQGPIMTMFGLEMTAKQLYPDAFGEWPGYVDGEPLPEIPDDEQLFDRQRLAEIINGANA